MPDQPQALFVLNDEHFPVGRVDVPDNGLCGFPHILAVAAVRGLCKPLLILSVQVAYHLAAYLLHIPDVVKGGDFL